MSDKKEYIERGALKAHYSWLPKDATLTPKDFDDIIDAQPAVDVEPVVRGEWREFDADMNAYVCSVCDEPYVLIDGTPEQNHYNYCPNCGAHMERSDSRAATNQVDRCMTCDNNGKPICSSCIMTGHGNDIDFYKAATEPKGEHHD